MTVEQVIAGWDTGTLGQAYALVADHTVPADVRGASKAAATVASALLVIDTPTTIWFEPEGEAEAAYRARYRGADDWLSFRREDDVHGVAHRDGRMIGVRADLTPADAIETTGHEIRHLAQTGSTYCTDEGEEEALHFGRKIRDFLTWTDDGRARVAKRVLSWPSFPYSGETLAGQAEWQERLLAHDGDGAVALWRNAGSKDCPRWVRWHTSF